MEREKTIIDEWLERTHCRNGSDHPTGYPCSVWELARDEAAQIIAEGFESAAGKPYPGGYEVENEEAACTRSQLLELGRNLARDWAADEPEGVDQN